MEAQAESGIQPLNVGRVNAAASLTPMDALLHLLRRAASNLALDFAFLIPAGGRAGPHREMIMPRQFEQTRVEADRGPLAFEHRTFFTRLHQFVLTSDAFIVAPGGIGTVLETMMIWQLLQVRHLENTPLILVGKMWPGLIEWARAAMLSTEPPLANAADMAIPRCVANADEAIAVIREYHQLWLSGCDR